MLVVRLELLVKMEPFVPCLPSRCSGLPVEQVGIHAVRSDQVLLEVTAWQGLPWTDGGQRYA